MSLVHEHLIRVRYAETDQMGVAYYSNYLVWFEVGRAEFCRYLGFSYAKMEGETKSFSVVAVSLKKYRAPLRYDQDFKVRTRLTELRRRALTFGYEVIDPKGEKVFATGETKHVITDEKGRPKSIPEEYRLLLERAIESEGQEG
jgi:acyl-CoA thioester hydrolase